jgi:ABC-2 type transport system ATP-binding protein
LFGFPAGTVAARRMLGYLPEVSNFHEFLTATELLMIHAALAGVPSAERAPRCKEALETVGLGERMKARISEFSKGMKQRFGIAQAMVAKPRLLILDELTSGLDPIAQLELKEIMIKLRSAGTTIFFSSHHMAEVEAVCDRVGILHRGKLRVLGRLDELLVKPDTVKIHLRLSQEAQARLAEQFGCPITPVKDGEYSFTLARSEVDKVLEFTHQEGGHLISLAPYQIRLEEFYFKTVQDANREDGVAS